MARCEARWQLNFYSRNAAEARRRCSYFVEPREAPFKDVVVAGRSGNGRALVSPSPARSQLRLDWVDRLGASVKLSAMCGPEHADD